MKTLINTGCLQIYFLGGGGGVKNSIRRKIHPPLPPHMKNSQKRNFLKGEKIREWGEVV